MSYCYMLSSMHTPRFRMMLLYTRKRFLMYSNGLNMSSVWWVWLVGGVIFTIIVFHLFVIT